jgi:hypothetical protein
MAPSKTASASATATPAPASAPAPAPAQAPAPVPAPATTSKPRPKQTKMPTPQEMQELYDRITPLQKIVTLQHIYSLYMAAAQSPSPKKDVSFNIIQLQRMINSNPLVNPDFDFLNVKNTSNATAHTGAVAGKGPVSPVQLIQILTESLTLGDTSNGGGGNGNGSGNSTGKNEQVIQQVPNTMLFKLSRFIDLNFVKDRLIKLLNAYKNTTCKEIEDLQTRWKTKQDEIAKIEQGKMDDSVLYEEFLRDLKRKRGVVDKRDKSSTPTPTGTPTGAATAVSTPPTVAAATASAKVSATGNTTESKDVFVDAAESPETGTGTGTGAESKTKPSNPKLTPSKPEPIAHKTRSSSKHKLDESSEPNEPSGEAPSPKRAKLRTRSHDASTSFQTQALRALSILSSNPLAEPILRMPATIAEYKRVVKRPRDLQSITRGVEAGDIADRDTLMYDVQLAFANVAMYSGADMREAVQAWDAVAESLP